MRRLARIGDGWFPQRFGPDKTGQTEFKKLRSYIKEAGRNPSDVGIEPRISVSQGHPDDWVKEASAWKQLGVIHLSVNTMGAGFSSLSEHISSIEKFKDAIGTL